MLRRALIGLGLLVVASCGSRTPMDEPWEDHGTSNPAGGGKNTGGSHAAGSPVHVGGSKGTGGRFYPGAGGSAGKAGGWPGSTGGYHGTGGHSSGGWRGSGGAPFGTGGYGTAGNGGSAGYRLAQPGRGLLDILPNVNNTDECFGCVSRSCPEAIDCSKDEVCGQQMSCLLGLCAERGLTWMESCVGQCVRSDTKALTMGLDGVGCIFQVCQDECTTY